MKKYKLTRKEFVEMAEDGAVFEFDGAKYFFADNFDNPYRFNNGVDGYTQSIDIRWRYFNGENEFILVEEPKIERVTNTGKKVFVVVGQTQITNYNIAAFLTKKEAEDFINSDEGKARGTINKNAYVEEHVIETCTAVAPVPKIERRWIWLKDYIGITESSSHYISENKAREFYYEREGWYKKEDDYIDVEVK